MKSDNASTLILASQSFARKELLSELVEEFIVQPADVDESTIRGEKPFDYCKRVTRAKAMKIHELNPDATVIAADTPVIVGRRIIQSAFTREQAEEMLALQSGRRVYIPTAVCVITSDGEVFEDMSKSWVKFKPLTKSEKDWYLSNKDNWYGASGAIKIKHSSIEALMTQVNGSISGIVGLPLYQTAKLLRRAGVEVF